MVSGDNALIGQPIYAVGDDRVMYVCGAWRCVADVRAIYEALQADAEVGPHRFAAATTFVGSPCDAATATVNAVAVAAFTVAVLNPLDAETLARMPQPSAVHGEAIDDADAIGEWSEWCAEVVEGAEEDADNAMEVCSESHVAVRASATWAFDDAERLAAIHRELAREEVEEVVAQAMPRLDLAQTRRLKVLVKTWLSGQMAAAN